MTWKQIRTKFDPKKHGFHFDNDFTVRLKDLNSNLGNMELGNGLCGGMSLMAMRKFAEGQKISTATELPPRGSALRNSILAAQYDSLFPKTWFTFGWWMNRPTKPGTFKPHTIGHETKLEWPAIKESIERGAPCVLGIVISGKGVSIASNHQVLAIGYRYNKKTKKVIIETYDPNHHDKITYYHMDFGASKNQLNAYYTLDEDDRDKSSKKFFRGLFGNRFIKGKVNRGQVHINQIVTQTIEGGPGITRKEKGWIGPRVDTKTWSGGWSLARTYAVNRQPYLFLLKSGDGEMHCHKFETQEYNAGMIGELIDQRNWSEGWTSATTYTVGNATYLLILKKGNGLLRVHQFLSDGKIGPLVYEENIGKNWTIAEQFKVQNKSFVFFLKTDFGSVRILSVLQNGALSSEPVFEKKWARGWTSATFYEVMGTTFLLLLKEGSGAAHLHKINSDGSVGTKLRDYNWSTGWSSVQSYQIDNAPYLFLLKQMNGAVHLHRPSSSKVEKRIKEYQWTPGWSTVQTYQVNGKPYLFLLKEYIGDPGDTMIEFMKELSFAVLESI